VTPEKIIGRGIEVCGSRTELASHLGISTSSLDKWKVLDILPAKHCNVLYRLTGIPLWQMNPDYWDRELTLSEAWEVDIMHKLRRLKDPELLKDIETMLDLE
jgi:DNA-binding transcriptional regulator YdaS (Cro superfamily)